MGDWLGTFAETHCIWKGCRWHTGILRYHPYPWIRAFRRSWCDFFSFFLGDFYVHTSGSFICRGVYGFSLAQGLCVNRAGYWKHFNRARDMRFCEMHTVKVGFMIFYSSSSCLYFEPPSKSPPDPNRSNPTTSHVIFDIKVSFGSVGLGIIRSQVKKEELKVSNHHAPYRKAKPSELATILEFF